MVSLHVTEGADSQSCTVEAVVVVAVVMVVVVVSVVGTFTNSFACPNDQCMREARHGPRAKRISVASVKPLLSSCHDVVMTKSGDILLDPK